MEEKEVVVEETTEELEVQNTFNEDSIEELIDSENCIIENLDKGDEE